ncbi:MAG: 30S ribosomal protein S20 [Deltaproteobacteria bacterium]|nr:30S ribosomal protein S20 [Deltaproteobacteria bacterium]
MANHKSALKRARQSKVRRLRNLSFKTRVKNAVKDVRIAATSDSRDQAKEKLEKAVSIIQKTATKGIIHKNKASRKVSSLTRLVNQMTPS